MNHFWANYTSRSKCKCGAHLDGTEKPLKQLSDHLTRELPDETTAGAFSILNTKHPALCLLEELTAENRHFGSP